MKREAKQSQQIAVRWCHVNVPADSIIYIFFSHTGSFESTTDQAQSESHKTWRDNRTQWRKKKARRRRRRKSLCFIYLSIHSFKAGHGISSFYAIGKREWHVQGNQWRQRVKDAGWQLRQLITLEKPERQQRMKAVSDSRLGYRLVPMPLVAWGKISKRWLNLDSLSKEQQQLYKSALGEETVVIHIVIASEHNHQIFDSSPACTGHITKRRNIVIRGWYRLNKQRLRGQFPPFFFSLSLKKKMQLFHSTLSSKQERAFFFRKHVQEIQ